jgi:hypothetical protein
MTDDLLHLLTAAVDGELSPPEQWRVQQLLVESAEARSLLARLQSDSIRLKNAPKLMVPAYLDGQVMARLPKSEPARDSLQRTRSRFWVAFSIAASLFLAVCAGAAWVLDKPRGVVLPQPDHPMARVQLNDVLPLETVPMPAAVAPTDGRQAATVDPPVTPSATARFDEIPPPRLKNSPPSDVLTAPLVPIPPIERMIVRIPLLVSVADLDREDARQRFADELDRDGAVRIDLFAKDASRGAEHLQTAAKNAGITLFTDAGAAERIKKKHASSYVVYCESLTAAEVRDLFTRISTDDGKAPQRIFGSLHAAPALAADQKDLKELLGTDPGLWKRPVAPRAAADPTPLSAGTGDQLTKSLTAKPGDKPAILLSFTPAALRTNPAMSKELKEFLARRGERKASAVPILIVIRQH